MFPGPVQLLIVLAILLLLFGGKRIPEAMRSVGRSIVEFKKGVKETDEGEDKSAATDA